MDIVVLLTQISDFLTNLSNAIWGMPFLLFFFGVCVFMTLQLGFVQFRYLAEAVRLVFQPRASSGTVSASGNLSPFQAFMNTLGSNIGNGSLSGIPVGIVVGGPGAMFWLLVMSTFAVALRFAEVYLATHFSDKSTAEKSGPMYYLGLLPGGAILSMLFSIFGFIFLMIGGNLAQCNAVGIALNRAWGFDIKLIAAVIFVLVLYVVIGGAQRIVSALDKLVPVKVYGFLISVLAVLAYHWAAIPQALYLIVNSAFEPQAILGGTFAFAIQKTIAWGFMQGANAGEAGLGTAAVAFGTTRGQDPMKSGIMSMLSVYVTTHMVCFLVALCVIASGVWNNGETSTALLVSAYETVFGSIAGLLISLLVVIFASSVVVAVAFSSKVCWDYLSKRKLAWLFPIFYATASALGTLMNPTKLFGICGIATAILFMVNALGLLWFVGIIKSGVRAYSKKHA